MRPLIIIILIAVFGCFLSNHNTYSYNILNDNIGSTFIFRSLPSMPVDFRIDGGSMGGLNGLTIIQNACNEWDSLPNIGEFCGTLTQISTDITSANFNALVNLFGGTNDIVFDNTGQILSGFGLSPTVLGVGISNFNASGEITDITIILNGSIPQSALFDYLGLTIHEMGHTWGLAHTAIGGINEVDLDGLDPIDEEGIPTMFPLSFPTNDVFSRTLETDDYSAALLLYGP